MSILAGLKITRDPDADFAEESVQESGDNSGSEIGALDPDPVPGGYDAPAKAPPRRRASRKGPGAPVDAPSAAPPRPAAPVSARVRKEVEEEVQTYLEMVALAWSVPDPVCGTALSDESRVIAERITALLVRSPRLLERMREAGLLGDWLKLAIALKPLVTAMYRHHVRPEPEEDGPPVFDPSMYPPGGIARAV